MNYGQEEYESQESELPPLPNLYAAYSSVPQEDDVPMDTPQDVTEEQQIVSNDYELPDYLGDEWKPPADATEQWYKDKYKEMATYANTDEFKNSLLTKYQEDLINAQSDADKIGEAARALMNNDKRYLLQYFPEKLAELGIEPTLSPNEIASMVEQTMKQEFDENYKDIFDSKHLLDPTSKSAQIYTRSQELLKYYNEINEQRKEAFKSYQTETKHGVKPQVTREEIYEQVKDKLAKEDFDSTMDYVVNNADSWTVMDLRKIMTYDTDIQKSYEQGKADAIRELKRVGNAQPVHSAPSRSKEVYNEPESFNSYLGRLVRN